jgi:LAS superfamily LD-carboxypeptidase LdcB
MNRLEFINAGLAILGWSCYQPSKNMNTDPHLLIGKGSPKLVGKNYALLPEADNAFQEMSVAAQKQGITIKVVSSYRSFERQKSIWNRKFLHFKSLGLEDQQAIKKIIEYSTLPGTSRHHWGTDIDIIDAGPPEEGDVLLPNKFHDNGPYNSLREWMEAHGQDYGFHLPYNKNEERSGFKYEPWHYSFAPKSIPMLRQYLELDHARLILTSDLEGEKELDQEFLKSYIQSHVMGIDPVLL